VIRQRISRRQASQIIEIVKWDADGSNGLVIWHIDEAPFRRKRLAWEQDGLNHFKYFVTRWKLDLERQ
jgi:hypothetical protein